MFVLSCAIFHFTTLTSICLRRSNFLNENDLSYGTRGARCTNRILGVVGRTRTRGTSMNGEKRGRRWRGREPISEERQAPPCHSFNPSVSLSLSLSTSLLVLSQRLRSTHATTSGHPPPSTVSRHVGDLLTRGHPLPFKAVQHESMQDSPLLVVSCLATSDLVFKNVTLLLDFLNLCANSYTKRLA